VILREVVIKRIHAFCVSLVSYFQFVFVFEFSFHRGCILSDLLFVSKKTYRTLFYIKSDILPYFTKITETHTMERMSKVWFYVYFLDFKEEKNSRYLMICLLILKTYISESWQLLIVNY